MLRPRLVALFALLPVACSETRRAEYATYAAAARAGAIERGWIPSYVPPSATEIAEAHDLDLNTQRLRFRLSAAELPGFVTALEPLAPGAPLPPAVRAPAPAGPWPPSLSDRVVPREGPLAVYLTRGGATPRCVAVDRITGTVYAWSCESPAS